MNTINTNSGPGGGQLKSELARLCLPRPHAHDERNLAWANSICLLFLIIGLVGFRPAPPPAIVIRPLEEPAPVMIAPPPPPPSNPVELNQDNNPPDKPDVPQTKVLVTLPSPAILFASPTINGTLVAPKEYRVPSAVNLAPQTPPPPEKPAPPSRLESTGQGGLRPAPPYPAMAEQLGQQGSVELLLTADEAGLIISAEVKESSGSSILDRASVEFVKRHWTVSPGARGRLFQARINYKLTSS
jgi:TonB family protein